MIVSQPPMSRLATIAAAIRSGRFPNPPRLARELKVSLCTVMCNLEFIRGQVGTPVEYYPVRVLYTG